MPARTPICPLKTRKVQAINYRRDDPEVVLMLRAQRDDPGAYAELVERARAERGLLPGTPG